MDLESLALAVDERVRVPAAERNMGRLYAVRSAPDPDDGDDDPAGGGPGARVVLELVAEGEARTLPQTFRPPAGLRAVALASGVWAAPLDERGPSPSRHPERRRAHLTVIVGAEGLRDGVDVSVLRYGDGEPTVLRGGAGLIHQRLLRCWSRRPDASWATRRTDRAA
ncbi:MAG TPA: hypothetical protein VGO87_12870 [Acidimicrobiia bacterium]|jgi:hypothetical protein